MIVGEDDRGGSGGNCLLEYLPWVSNAGIETADGYLPGVYQVIAGIERKNQEIFLLFAFQLRFDCLDDIFR